MAIVHLHVERTAGVSLQHLYEQRYPGPGFLWYSTRDGMFAPFNIQHGRYHDTQMHAHARLAREAPDIRARILRQRTEQRSQQAVPPEQLASKADVVLGHFALNMISRYLPVQEHEYRTVVRDPLQRMWSHYNFWRAYNGDVGHRAVAPTANHFSDPMPELSAGFVAEFQDMHREDYAFYATALVRSTQPVAIEV